MPLEVRGQSGERRSRSVHAVIRALPPDQDRAFGLPGERPVAPDHLRRRVDRVGATAREEGDGALDRRDRRDPLRESGRRRIREVLERGVGLELPHLRRDRVGDLPPAVPDVAVPERGGRVEVASALGVPDVRALAAHDGELVLRNGGHVRERMPEPRHPAAPCTIAGNSRTGAAGCQPGSSPSTSTGVSFSMRSRYS